MADGDSLGIMATTVGSGVAPRAVPRAAADVPRINYAVLFAATSAVVGVIWDISWHLTIGRDTFWTPAHLRSTSAASWPDSRAAGSSLRTTFAGTPDEEAAGVSFWGFRAPLGAWVCIWGAHRDDHLRALRQLVAQRVRPGRESASPPHTVLALGFTAIELGALLFVVARQNRLPPSAVSHPEMRLRTADGGRRTAGLFVAYGFGVLLCNFYIMGFEYIAFPNDMHKMFFYQVCALVFPMILVAAARAARLRWPATTAAAVYMAIHLLMIWILQSFPATPKLAPIYNPLTHMVPPPFPILLVVPAFAIDLILHRLERLNDWLRNSTRRGGIRQRVVHDAMVLFKFPDLPCLRELLLWNPGAGTTTAEWERGLMSFGTPVPVRYLSSGSQSPSRSPSSRRGSASGGEGG